MQALIDADILRYEVGFCGERKNEEGENEIFHFDSVEEILLQRLRVIQEEVEADEPPRLFLTGDEKLCKKYNLDYKPNFREAIAVKREYKGTRKKAKPFHFNNLTTYLIDVLGAEICVGLEADDIICAEHVKDPDNTIICSRDKDLRMCPGKHYSWECGKQAAIGPVDVDALGWLEKLPKKVLGYGAKFFYYQLLVGDAVDNIPGLRGYGPVKAYGLLNEVDNERKLYEVVRYHYQQEYADDWKPELIEQANLLWMVREFKEDGSPVMFRPPPEEV